VLSASYFCGKVLINLISTDLMGVGTWIFLLVFTNYYASYKDSYRVKTQIPIVKNLDSIFLIKCVAYQVAATFPLILGVTVVIHINLNYSAFSVISSHYYNHKNCDTLS